MTFQVSPGVNVSEIDNTTSIAPVSTAIGAFVGAFRWGPVEDITTVDSEADLVRNFGSPNAAASVDFHTAAYFLKYSRDLRVVHAEKDAFSANTGGAADLLIKNDEEYDSATLVFANHGHFIARHPGALGNSLKVSVFGFKTDTSTTATNFSSWAYSSNFDGPVGTSAYATRFGSSNDEIHVAVIDEDGMFTGIKGSILEVFPYLSQASDGRAEDGASTYYADVINATSEYIRFGAADSTNFANAGDAATGAVDYAVTPSNGTVDASLTGGDDGAALTPTEYLAGWDLFADPDTIEVSLLIAPSLSTNTSDADTVADDLIATAEARKDCVAFISPARGLDVEGIIAFADGLQSSSYAFVDSGRLKVYDKYNDTYINIPACSSIAGLTAETDRTVGSWYSPAGLRRGQLRGVTKLYLNPSKTDRDALYKRGVNPVVTFPGEGTLLFGDKTKLGRPSAFDRINVRRLFITLEKAISRASRSNLFEFNDVFTRAEFVNLVEPFLRTVQGRRGIIEFKVQADEFNNTGDVIDRNEFVGDIYIKPARSINYIKLNFIATRTGVAFNEITGG